jgi:hypothetical protein
MNKPLPLAILSIIVVGCGQVPTNVHEPSKSARTIATCCNSETKHATSSLEPNKPLVLELNGDAPSFHFSQGVSRAAFVRIPADLPTRKLLLKSHPLGVLIATLDIFCPSIEFLDNDGNVVTSIIDAPLAYRREMTWTSNGHYYTLLDIPPNAVQAAFHTTEAALNLKVPYPDSSTGYTFMAGKTPIFVNSGYGGFAIPCVKTGRLEVEVR